MHSFKNSNQHQKGRYVGSMVQTTITLSVLMALSNTGHATQYSLKYEVDGRYRYNDNVGLRPNNEVDIHGAELSLPAEFTMADERYSAHVKSEISSVKYDESGYDSDDQSLEAGGEYSLERGGITANIGIDRDSTTETAFLDNGIVGASADRVERYFGNLTSIYYVTADNALIAGFRYGETDYNTTRLVDNESANGYVGLSHQYTERTAIQIRASASRFENDANIGVESDGVGVELGFNTTYSEKLTFSMLGGYSEVDTEYSTPAGIPPRDDDNSSGWILTSNLLYEGYRSSLQGSFIRRESASADGYLIVSNRFSVDYTYEFSERLNLRLGTIAGTSGALDSDINNDRDYAEGIFGLSYRLAQAWYLSGRYTYRYQDRETASGDATANLVTFTLRYKPNAFQWSR